MHPFLYFKNACACCALGMLLACSNTTQPAPAPAHAPETQAAPTVQATPPLDHGMTDAAVSAPLADAGVPLAAPPAAVGGRDAPRSDARAPASGGSTARAGMQPSAAGTAGASSTAGAPSAPAQCSGCAQETTDKTDMSVHLHHVHLNVEDRERSTLFYTQHLAARRVKLNGAYDALHSTPMLILFDVKPTPVSKLPTALQHIGWGSTDTKAWYEAAHKQGVEPDTRGGLTVFTTEDTPMISEPGSGMSTAALLGGSAPACLPAVDPFAYMYVLGPDAERVEICSGANERVNHLHFTTPDLITTSHWYARFLGVGNPNATPILIYGFYLDDILIVIEEVGQASDYQPTDDHVLSHVAFSVSDLDVWLKRARDQNIQIVAQPAETNGFRSFFVRGPDGMLIELVQAAASKELCLNDASSLPPPIIPKDMK